MTPTRPGPPLGLSLQGDIEYRPDRPLSYRARVRWTNPATKARHSKSEAFAGRTQAEAWVEEMQRLARGGVDPYSATMTLAQYGDSIMPLAMRGLEPKTLDPYLSGWRHRVVPTLGHLAPRMVTNGAVDRAVHSWIADDCSRSTVKNSLAALVRVMEQAVRDGIVDRNPARVSGWQSEFRKAEDELDDPRALALADWDALTRLADALVARSADHFPGWGDITIFAACTAARIGEISGCRVSDIDTTHWLWTVRRQTTPSPGGLADKGTKGKRAPHRSADPRGPRHRPPPHRRRRHKARRPPVHRTQRRSHHHRRPARRHPLGRGRRRPRLRTPPPTRAPPHRTDLAGRRRRPRTRPAQDRRARLPDHNPALPTPRPPDLRRRRRRTHRVPTRPAVPQRSPSRRGVDHARNPPQHNH
jgi:hypothetical protein